MNEENEPIIQRTSEGYRLPGLVDAHVHVESSHLRPSEFGRLLVANGTMAAVCDPHEIVNVAGETGLDFMLEDARLSPAALHFALPSSVPATPFETSGAAIDAARTAELFDRHPEIVALAEVMNVPGVLSGDSETLAKIAAACARGKRVDGHFPLGRGESVRRYAAAGISSDHESSTPEEAREKLAAGMTIFIREGSSAKNLAALVPLVTAANYRQFCFCTDDLSAADLARGEGILACVRKAVRMGIPPKQAIAMASVNPCRHYGLNPDPESSVIVRDLKDFEIVRVIPPRCAAVTVREDAARVLRASVILPDLADFALPVPPKDTVALRAIGVNPTDLVTDNVEIPVGGPSACWLAVIERHGRNGNRAFAPVVGVGRLRGAIASTIGHDSHNLTVLGSNADDMRCAAERLKDLGGGAVVLSQGRVLAELPLPLGGLMSDRPAELVAAQDLRVKVAASEIGCTLPEPLTTLSFLTLPVIPRLKLTDCGLFDVEAARFVSPWISEAVAKPQEERALSRSRPRQSAALPSGDGGFASASSK